jgi:hypothetical protein
VPGRNFGIADGIDAARPSGKRRPHKAPAIGLTIEWE